MFALTGRRVFAEPQQGMRRLRVAGTSRRPPRGRRRTHGGGHKDGHQGFHPCESRFLYFLVWRRSETGDRFEKGERQSGYSCVSFSAFSRFTDNVLLHIRLNLRRRNMTVLRNFVNLEFTHGTYGLGVWYKLFSQALSVTTRSRIVRHGYPPGDPLLPCGQFTLCPCRAGKFRSPRRRNHLKKENLKKIKNF